MAPVWSLTTSFILKYIIAVWLLRQRSNFLNYFIHLTLRLIRETRNLMLLLGSDYFRKNLIILSDIIFILLHLSILLRRRLRVLCICKSTLVPCDEDSASALVMVPAPMSIETRLIWWESYALWSCYSDKCITQI